MFDTHFEAWVWRIERPSKVLILVFVLGSGKKKKRPNKILVLGLGQGEKKTKRDLVFRLGSKKKAKQNIACSFEARSGEQNRPNKILILVFGPLILVSGKREKKD